MPKPKKPKKALTDEEMAEKQLQKQLKMLLDRFRNVCYSHDPSTPNFQHLIEATQHVHKIQV